MNALTLFAIPPADGAGSPLLRTESGRFSVGATLCHHLEGAYVHLRAGFHSPDAEEGFGFFHVVVDADGALLQMAVGETDEQVGLRIIERMRENEIELADGTREELRATLVATRKASMLCAKGTQVSVRAKAYPSADPDGESLVCLRLLVKPFGATQVVISDLGRLLAIATGRRDREAYQRVRHELIRRGFELDEVDAEHGNGAE